MVRSSDRKMEKETKKHLNNNTLRYNVSIQVVESSYKLINSVQAALPKTINGIFLDQWRAILALRRCVGMMNYERLNEYRH